MPIRQDNIGMSESDADARYLKLDQTTPQTVINGIPTFFSGITSPHIKNSSGVEFGNGTNAFLYAGLTSGFPLVGGDSITDNGAKIFRIAVRNYNNEAFPVTMLSAQSASEGGTSTIAYGGGTSLGGSMQSHAFYIGNGMTATGTEEMRLTGAGLRIQPTGTIGNPSAPLHVESTSLAQDADLSIFNAPATYDGAWVSFEKNGSAKFEIRGGVTSGGTEPTLWNPVANTGINIGNPSGYMRIIPWSPTSAVFFQSSLPNFTFSAAGGTAGTLLQFNFADSDLLGKVHVGATAPTIKTQSLNVQGSMGISNASGFLRIVTAGGVNYIQSGTDGTTGSAAPLRFTPIGSSTSLFAIEASEIVVNDSSQNLDFRVEGDGNANLILCDASADTVFMGTSTLPSAGKARLAVSLSHDGSTNYEAAIDAINDVLLTTNRTGNFQYGLNFVVQKRGNYNFGSQRGIISTPYQYGTGATTNTMAFLGQGPSFRGAGADGSVTNGYVFYASSPSQISGALGTVGTEYGLYIEEQKKSFVTTGYSIYSAGASDTAYFAGTVSIGTLTLPSMRYGAILSISPAGVIDSALTSDGVGNLSLLSGTSISWDGADVSITHAANTLKFSGATSGYWFKDGLIRPEVNDGVSLGDGNYKFSDLFLASGAVINFNKGDITLTHASNVLTMDGGSWVFNEAGGNFDWRIEGDTDQYLLFCDASADSIGVGTSTTGFAKLAVETTTLCAGKFDGNGYQAYLGDATGLSGVTGAAAATFYNGYQWASFASDYYAAAGVFWDGSTSQTIYIGNGYDITDNTYWYINGGYGAYFSGSTGSVYLCDSSYLFNFYGSSGEEFYFSSQTLTLNFANFVSNGSATFGSGGSYEVYLADSNNLRAGYFTDFTTAVALCDGTYAINSVGNVWLSQDNDHLYVGAGSDIDIYHDGTDSFIVTDATQATDLIIDCGTNKTLELAEAVWDDLRVTPAGFDRVGIADPALVSYQPGGSGIATYLYEFQVDDIAYFTVQLPHGYKQGSDISVHVHWTPGPNGVTEIGKKVGWKVDYSWANIDGTFSAMATADLSDACDGTNHKHQMTPAVTISGSGKNISSMLICNIKRTDTGTDDDWGGTASGALPMILEIDFHYQIDTLGSRQIGTK